jgi:hypothetical protein
MLHFLEFLGLPANNLSVSIREIPRGISLESLKPVELQIVL